MFSGIVREKGKIIKKRNFLKGIELEIEVKKILPQIKKGSSVAVNGVCLTVKEKREHSFLTDLGKETLKKTTLAEIKPREEVNLEPSLRVGDEISGHFVLGHVDCVGKIASMKKVANGLWLAISFPKEIKKYIIKKGSVAINGVSLTINEVRGNKFEIFLVPFTLEETVFAKNKIGDEVNIEADILARYLKG